MFFTLFKTSLFLLSSLSLVWFCDGYKQGCDKNLTLYVEEGSDAAFIAEDFTVRYYLRFLNTSYTDTTTYIFVAKYPFSDNLLHSSFLEILRFTSAYLKDRIDVSVTGPHSLTIVLKDIKTSDNGTYILSVDHRFDICWTLFVINIQTDKGKGPVEEGLPLSFKVNRPILEGGIDQEITASWTYDGRHIKETNHFLVYGDLIMIPKVTRELNGKNVTYKMEDNDGGVLLLVNLTLQVHYGPSWPLQLIPPKTAYFLTPGDILPKISCDVDCNPACNASWGDYGSGRKLNLGEVATDDTGEYVCTAYRNGSNLVIHRSVYVYVQDMSSSTVILGGVLALNTLALTCTIVYICCRRCVRCKTLPTCLMRFKVRGEVPHKELHNTGVIAAQGHMVAPDKRMNYEEFSTGSELATYTDLEQDNSAYANTEIEASVMKRIV